VNTRLVAQRQTRKANLSLHRIVGLSVAVTLLVVLLVVALIPAFISTWRSGRDNTCRSHGSFEYMVDDPYATLGSVLTDAYRAHHLSYSGDQTPLVNETERLNGKSIGDSTIQNYEVLQIPICTGP